MKKVGIRTAVIYLAVCLFMVCWMIPAAVGVQAAEESKVVRVGYYEDGDFMSRNEEGDYVGFNFEYLQEIAKYTGWEYEVVDGRSWENTLKLLEAGEIDLLPSVFYTQERADKYLFSAQPMCNIYITLNVRADDERYDFEEFDSFRGMKVGVIQNSEDAESFRLYCRKNKIDADIIPYTETSELLSDLEDGTLDGAAITHLGKSSTFRSVAQFSPEPLYIALAPGSSIGSGLDYAMNTIKLRNADFDARLYKKYFSVSMSQKPVFTKEEKEYIENVDTITAVYDATWLPLEYTGKSGVFLGVVADLFRSISNDSGLPFSFVPATDIKDSLRLMEEGKADLICGVTGDYLWSSRNNLNTTQYYLRAPVVLVGSGRNKITQTIAMKNGYFLAQKIAEDNLDKTVLYFNSPEECFEAMLDGKADAVYVNTHIADYLLSDARFEGFTVSTLTNYAEEMRIGISKSADPRLFSILDKCIQYTASEQMDEIILQNTIYPNTVTLQALIRQYPAAVIGGIIIFFTVMTVLLAILLIVKSRSKKSIEKLLYKDGLTGLWNLNKFHEEAERLVMGAAKESYAVIYVDIKQFRTINDTFGFGEGDKILCAFANILTEVLAADECCARVSADKFVLLLRYESWDSLTARTADMDARINGWVQKQGRHYHLIVVFGVYIVVDTETADISRMLDFAGYAERSASATHKSLTVLYDMAMRQEGLLQRELADRMQGALDAGEFIPYFQPKVDMPSGKLVGSEALVRWNNTGRGLIAPGLFIPFFEKNGFVVEIDMYIYEQVCISLRKWLDLGWQVCPVSCNFSRLHFKNPLFPDRLAEIADRCRIPHHYVELEVTESVFVGSLDQILQQFKRLKELGFVVSIDDFGSGYSSLGLLQQFSADVLKLDRSFIQEGMRGAREQTVVRGVIQMAKELDMKVVCEGVETAEQVESLVEMGCYTAQGFYYARPMPQDEFEQKLKESASHLQKSGTVPVF